MCSEKADKRVYCAFVSELQTPLGVNMDIDVIIDIES